MMSVKWRRTVLVRRIETSSALATHGGTVLEEECRKVIAPLVLKKSKMPFQWLSQKVQGSKAVTTSFFQMILCVFAGSEKRHFSGVYKDFALYSGKFTWTKVQVPWRGDIVKDHYVCISLKWCNDLGSAWDQERSCERNLRVWHGSSFRKKQGQAEPQKGVRRRICAQTSMHAASHLALLVVAVAFCI